MTNETKKPLLLTFKTTVSRGRDTYGYNIVSLYVDGKKETSCNGGGYDMHGTALAMYIEREYQSRLLSIADRAYTTTEEGAGLGWTREKNEDGLYGMTLRIPKCGMHSIELDGGCGITSIERIAKAAGITLTSTKTGKNQWGYFLTI